VAVSPKSVQVDLQIPSKTSLMMVTSHQEGSLVECLNILHKHGINVCKLESRPKLHEPFRYSFYVDIESNLDDPNTDKALQELGNEAEELKVLGSYAKQIK